MRKLTPKDGAQWLSGRVLDSRPKGRGFEPHWRHCVVSLSKNINPSLVLVQPRKTRPFITEILLIGRKESNQTNKNTKRCGSLTHIDGQYLLFTVYSEIFARVLLSRNFTYAKYRENNILTNWRNHSVVY